MHPNVLENLPLKLNLYQLKHLTSFLKTSEKQLRYILSIKSRIIKEIKIPKKNSDESRKIQFPKGEYKFILKRLHKILKSRSKFPNSVCGGIIDKNLFEMVKSHCGKEVIYQIDLKDFFPNINSNRINAFFTYSGCSNEISDILTELVSFEGKLPQGFSTSPIIANLIAWKMDYDLGCICKKYNLNITRWVDDILISGRIFDLNEAINKIDNSIKKNGFIIHKKKKRIIRRANRKIDMIAVGLDLRKHKPDVPINVYEKLEYMLQVFIREGKEFALELFEEEFKSKDIQQSLKGKIRFVQEYNKYRGGILKDLFNQIVWN
jgi:hypothetical protein